MWRGDGEREERQESAGTQRDLAPRGEMIAILSTTTRGLEPTLLPPTLQQRSGAAASRRGRTIYHDHRRFLCVRLHAQTVRQTTRRRGISCRQTCHKRTLHGLVLQLLRHSTTRIFNATARRAHRHLSLAPRRARLCYTPCRRLCNQLRRVRRDKPPPPRSSSSLALHQASTR